MSPQSLKKANGEERSRRGLLLLAVFLVEDDVVAVLALEHGLEVLAVLDGVDQPGGLGLLGRIGAAVDPLADLLVETFRPWRSA